MSIEAGIRDLIVRQGCAPHLNGEIPDDLPLLEAQALDSLGVFELITYLEQTYGIEVGDDEAVPENFGTVASIKRFVESKLATASA